MAVTRLGFCGMLARASDTEDGAMYADYQEFAATFARPCRERRNAEEEAQYERDKSTKPATVSSAADVRKTGPGAGLVFKTRADARVADADDDGASVERRASAKCLAGSLSPHGPTTHSGGCGNFL